MILAVPVLKTTASLLTTPEDIMKNIINFYMNIPSNYCEVLPSIEHSFELVSAQYGDNRDNLVNAMNNDLITILKNAFPNNTSVETDVSYQDVDDVNYNIYIYIGVKINDVLYELTQNVKIDTTTKAIVI